MVVRSSWIAAAIVVCSIASAHADDAYVPPDFMAQLPPLPPSVDQANVWRLDLAEALQTALHQNLGIVIERQSVLIARTGITVAQGEFEPLLSLGYDHGRSDAPPLTVQEGGANSILTFITDDWNASISQRIETGMRLSANFTNGRARSSAGTAVEPLNYRSTLSVSIDQPLLRGFSTDLVVPRADILKARIASDKERQQLSVTAADVVERTEDAYWDVVAALYRYDLSIRSQARAEEQMALTRRQIDAGMMPPSDLIGADSTLAQRKLAVLQSEAAIEQAWDTLRSVLNLPREQWARPILPIELPRFTQEASSAEDALQVAIKHRPELAQVDLDLAASRISVRQAENNTLPQIDVALTGSLIGQDDHYGGALDGIGKADTHAYTVLLNFVWTPLNRAAGASAKIERVHHEQATLRREQLVQQMWLEVRGAVRDQISKAREVTAAAKFRELSTQSLEVEQRKFLSNQSSQFVLSQRQEELASAQLAELTAVLSHTKARTALLRATGRLLDERHIQLDAK